MPEAAGDEFKVFISLLSKLKTWESEHDQLVDLIAEQAELQSELQVIQLTLKVFPNLRLVAKQPI